MPNEKASKAKQKANTKCFLFLLLCIYSLTFEMALSQIENKEEITNCADDQIKEVFE